jgi:hypothetical protein
MASEQLCFFKFSRPLLDQFGKEFFSGAPAVPGVYIFSEESGRALYVGHSRNLRTRLSYYKNAQPEREPRRIVRLVHQVRRIEMETCESVASAQIRELALIRQLRPKFNVANTLSPTFSYFGVRESGGGFSLRICMGERKREGESLLGGFKNAGLCRRAFHAIARTIAASDQQLSSVYDFPAALTSRTEISQLAPGWHPPVWLFLSGESGAFIDKTSALVQSTKDRFLRQIFENDLLTLLEFGQLAIDMAALRQAHETQVLSQDALQVITRLHIIREQTDH